MIEEMKSQGSDWKIKLKNCPRIRQKREEK